MERESLAASPAQIEAVREYVRAKEAAKDAMEARSRAHWACISAGLEFRFDHRGRSRWPEHKGDWRPIAGEPIRA